MEPSGSDRKYAFLKDFALADPIGNEFGKSKRNNDSEPREKIDLVKHEIKRQKIFKFSLFDK